MATLEGVVQFSGKLGNTVGMRGRSGKNYLRVRKTSIKNPRSDGQSIQRMILATVGVGISYMTEICNNSVEGKTTGQETLSYIRSQWMRTLRVPGLLDNQQLSFLKKGENRFALNPYMLSKGSIPTPEFTVESRGMVISSMPSFSDPDEILSLSPSSLFPGVELGNQLTFVFFYSDETYVGYETNATKVVYCRFAFKRDDVPALASLEDGGIGLNPLALDASKVSGPTESLLFDLPNQRVGLSADDFPFDLMGGSLIVSNIENQRRSTSFIKIVDLPQGTWRGNFTAAEAYPTYGNVSTSIDLASEIYLNNSTTPVGDETGYEALSATIDGREFPVNNGVLELPGFEDPTDIVVNLNKNYYLRRSLGLKYSPVGAFSLRDQVIPEGGTQTVPIRYSSAQGGEATLSVNREAVVIIRVAST